MKRQLISASLDAKDLIEISVLEEVEYVFDEFHKDMQRLSSAENKHIDYFQKHDQCLTQVPEGTPKAEWDKWEKARSVLCQDFGH